MNTKIATILFISNLFAVLMMTGLTGRCGQQLLGTAEYATWMAKQALVKQLTDYEDTVIFGDSSALEGFIPEAINPRTFNFALRGGNPYQAYYILKYMIESGKHPKNIVLSYNPDHYNRIDNSIWDQELFFSTDMISKENIKEMLAVDKEKSVKRIYPYVASDKVAYLPLYFNLAAGPLNHISLDFNFFLGNLKSHKQKFDLLYKSRGYFSPGSRPQGYIFTDTRTIANSGKREDDLMTYTLDKLFILADENNIKVFIIPPPIVESALEKQYSEEFIEQGLSIWEKYKSVHLEFAKPIPVADNMMQDDIHAFNEGALDFSRRVKPMFDSMNK